MSVNQISNGNDDGTLLGQSSTDKLGFFGLTTPIVQPALTPCKTVASATSTTPFGFVSAVDANNFIDMVYSMFDKLVALGLIAGR